jgi:hypothetical protein
MESAMKTIVAVLLLTSVAAADSSDLFHGKGYDPTTRPDTAVAVPASQPAARVPATQPATYNGVAELIADIPAQWLANMHPSEERRFSPRKLPRCWLALVRARGAAEGNGIVFVGHTTHPLAVKGQLRVSVGFSNVAWRRAGSKAVTCSIRGRIVVIHVSHAFTHTALTVTCADATLVQPEKRK